VSVTHRVAKVTAIVCGVQIPAGTIIAISPSVFNFDTEWGPTVNDFNPDRWEDISNQNLGRCLLTFLQGSRNCIGRGFAEMSMKVVLTTLIREFEFKIVAERPVTKWEMITTKPNGGMYLNISLRDKVT